MTISLSHFALLCFTEFFRKSLSHLPEPSAIPTATRSGDQSLDVQEHWNHAIVTMHSRDARTGKGIESVKLQPTAPTALKEVGETPSAFALDQNYANPFNPTIVILYSVTGTAGPGLGSSEVRLVVYDILGWEATK